MACSRGGRQQVTKKKKRARNPIDSARANLGANLGGVRFCPFGHGQKCAVILTHTNSFSETEGLQRPWYEKHPKVLINTVLGAGSVASVATAFASDYLFGVQPGYVHTDDDDTTGFDNVEEGSSTDTRLELHKRVFDRNFEERKRRRAVVRKEFITFRGQRFRRRTGERVTNPLGSRLRAYTRQISRARRLIGISKARRSSSIMPYSRGYRKRYRRGRRYTRPRYRPVGRRSSSALGYRGRHQKCAKYFDLITSSGTNNNAQVDVAGATLVEWTQNIQIAATKDSCMFAPPVVSTTYGEGQQRDGMCSRLKSMYIKGAVSVQPSHATVTASNEHLTSERLFRITVVLDRQANGAAATHDSIFDKGFGANFMWPANAKFSAHTFLKMENRYRYKILLQKTIRVKQTVEAYMNVTPVPVFNADGGITPFKYYIRFKTPIEFQWTAGSLVYATAACRQNNIQMYCVEEGVDGFADGECKIMARLRCRFGDG